MQNLMVKGAVHERTRTLEILGKYKNLAFSGSAAKAIYDEIIDLSVSDVCKKAEARIKKSDTRETQTAV